ncbi:FAD-dependent oxidoreductase [Yaniella flava]|uniref:FAD-dependent oxidoreductase n=1 Tax=Yaniella flava TaxID=287930 RepID=UPI0031D9F742
MKLLDNRELSTKYDMVVVGSGAAGLTAAATAAQAGLDVLVLEKSPLLGGTSAVSGGMLWIVANHHAKEYGIEDSKAAGRAYVEAASRGRGRTELLDSAVDQGDDMLVFLEAKLGVDFIFLDNFPDYRQDLPGAATGGRTVEPQLFNYHAELGGFADLIRTDGRYPFTMEEYEAWGAFTRFPWDELQERMEDGVAAKGHALVSMLVAACRRFGVTFAVNAAAERLRTEDGKVSGVVTADRQEITADAVMLASGGFEWDRELADSMLASRLYAVCSPPSNTGDGLKMAQRIGAAMRGTREAWWAPMSFTGGTRDGAAIGSLLRFERQGPGSIMVNRHGKRFANEAQNYNDLARSLQSWDSANNQTLNTPVHVVFDQSYLERYGILDHRAGQATPDYLYEAATLTELADKLCVPADALVTTVERFNALALIGVDGDFGRGNSEYDRYWGDANSSWPNPSLGPLQYGPYYALEVVNGAFGTSGGVGTDGTGGVVDVDGQRIEGLYAAGNVADSPYAAGYPGAGATLGPLMTMAYLAGKDIAARNALQATGSGTHSAGQGVDV